MPGAVDNLQTNSTTLALMPRQEATNVEVDDENSVAMLMAATEDLLHDISPLTCASSHPSSAYSVDDILEAAHHRRGRVDKLGLPYRREDQFPVPRLVPVLPFEMLQALSNHAYKYICSYNPECKQTRPKHETNKWDHIHSGSECRQATNAPGARTCPSLTSLFTSAVSRHLVWITLAMQVALVYEECPSYEDLLQEVEDLQIPLHKAASEELVKMYDEWLGLTIQIMQSLKDNLDLGDGIWKPRMIEYIIRYNLNEAAAAKARAADNDIKFMTRKGITHQYYIYMVYGEKDSHSFGTCLNAAKNTTIKLKNRKWYFCADIPKGIKEGFLMGLKITD
ncbi:hypothetical protein ARMSODRAFT_972724 [Armillaria solidipes]|uniref:Uncharacterized protein n=1 Tax=Armillaria solidipes TaxID=1076256 RepID=A0A2H3BQR9_9AGAR|nr:hypothetical protein ARMSODRAFT_972724 [Armillaria solidipes]